MKTPKILMKGLYALLFLFAPVFLQAQSWEQDEKAKPLLKKIAETYQKGKKQEAEKKLNKLLAKYPNSGEAWDMRSRMAYQEWENMKKVNFGNIKIETKVSGGDTSETAKKKADSLSQSLSKLFTGNYLGRIYEEKLLAVLRRATAYCATAEWSSVLIRTLFSNQKDTHTVTNVMAKSYFAEAEKYFSDGDYGKAAMYYSKTLEKDSNHYQAAAYMGDAYYRQKEYEFAEKGYKRAIAMRPYLLEARKYLVDALINQKSWEAAFEVCNDALLIYPDIGMIYKWRIIVHNLGKAAPDPRVARFAQPIDDNSEDFKDIDNTLKKNPHWKFYTEARENMKSQSDSAGLLAEHADKYLDLHCWKQMLAKAPKTEFALARRAQEEGFLDCYVLVFNMHQDTHGQFTHFIANNHEKALKFLTWAGNGYK
ncbi:MAG: hypothetical protein JNL57_08225 [Bacteroidetes bacterium]|nr:hypothetical protein [Bacteroidota bacterium]